MIQPIIYIIYGMIYVRNWEAGKSQALGGLTALIDAVFYRPMLEHLYCIVSGEETAVAIKYSAISYI